MTKKKTHFCTLLFQKKNYSFYFYIRIKINKMNIHVFEKKNLLGKVIFISRGLQEY